MGCLGKKLGHVLYPILKEILAAFIVRNETGKELK